MGIRIFTSPAADGVQPGYMQIFVCDAIADLPTSDKYAMNKGDLRIIVSTCGLFTTSDGINWTAEPSQIDIASIFDVLFNGLQKNFRILLLHYANAFGSVPPGLEDELNAAQSQ